MAQTFYIEADEEIISVVGRLRHTKDTEIGLIVPKHAILMQSIVSLKLLEREAKKIGKTILIITKDENGRALAEKAGLLSRPYQEESLPAETDILMPNAQTLPTPEVSFSEPKASYTMKAENIGSESFFAQNQSVTTERITPAPLEQESVRTKTPLMRIAVRDKSPQYQTALNSKQPLPLQGIMPKPSAVPPLVKNPQKSSQEFFSGKKPATMAPPEATPLARDLPKTSPPSPSAPVHSRVKLAIICAGIVVLLLMGVASFSFLTPKATVTIFPDYVKKQQTLELRLIHAGDAAPEMPAQDTSTLEMPYRLAEESIDIPLTITPTGVGTGGEQKARGKIIIYNTFSSEPQSLVATTRFETTDGIVFRLTQGVTVPGMTDIAGKRDPGAIEAEVIADQTGDASNIAPTTFTIPGFKGSPKYDKFSAKSLSTMTGGSKNGMSGESLLTGDDIEQAKNQAKNQALEAFRQKLSETLLDTEKMEESGIQITERSVEPVLHEGISGTSIASTFHYAAKAYIISESTLERALLRADSSSEKMTGTGKKLLPKSVSVDTLELVPDFQNGGGKLRVTASITLMPEIDTDSLRNEFLGEKSDILKQVLNAHPEILKMNLEVTPRFFIQYIPKNKDRVTVIIAPAQ
jgi:hypothetical protein